MGPWWHSCHRLRKECQPPPGEICQASWSHNACESSAVALKPQVMEQCLLWSRLSEARSADSLDENVYPTNYLVQLDMIFFQTEQLEKDLMKQKAMATFGPLRGLRDGWAVVQRTEPVIALSIDVILCILNLAACWQPKSGFMSLWPFFAFDCHWKWEVLIINFVSSVYNVLALMMS